MDLRREPTGTVQRIFKPGQPFRTKLNSLGVSDGRIHTVPLFEETTIVGDALTWKLNINKVMFEIITDFIFFRMRQPDKPFVPIAYSGGAKPMLLALSNPAFSGFGVETAIVVGAPMDLTAMTSGPLKRIINVYGTEDYFLPEKRDLLSDTMGTDFASLVPTIQRKFTHTFHEFETINIELVGIEHNRYFYNSDETPTKASDFIARLSQAALQDGTLEGFLRQFAGDPVWTVDVVPGMNQTVRTYTVNLDALVGL